MYGKGYQIVSSDVVLEASGKPMAVYGLNLVSDGTASKIILRNGTSTGGAAVITYTGEAGVGKVIDFGGVGVVFPAGCFVDVDAHISSATIWYEAV